MLASTGGLENFVLICCHIFRTVIKRLYVILLPLGWAWQFHSFQTLKKRYSTLHVHRTVLCLKLKRKKSDDAKVVLNNVTLTPNLFLFKLCLQ